MGVGGTEPQVAAWNPDESHEEGGGYFLWLNLLTLRTPLWLEMLLGVRRLFHVPVLPAAFSASALFSHQSVQQSLG